LKFLLYDQPASRRYTSWKIRKKSGGSRQIDSPCIGIRICQEKAAAILKPTYRVGPWVQAFNDGSSVVQNGRQHSKRPWVLNIDLSDFYGSINFGRVRGLLMSKPLHFPNTSASILAHLITYENRLPQGAPSSPLISNMIAWALDKNLLRLAREEHVDYTRYADDISFSSKKKHPPSALVTWEGQYPARYRLSIGDPLLKAISCSGFLINERKIRLQLSSVRQEVTGLTVNEFPNVQRTYIRNLRAMLNSWSKRTLAGAEAYHIENFAKNPYRKIDSENAGEYFKSVVYGHMAWLKSVVGDSQVYLRLCARLAKLDENPPRFIQYGKGENGVYDFFICHAGEDKDSVARPLEKALSDEGYSVFIDEGRIKWGDSFVGKINGALDKSRYIIAVLSANSVDRAWPKREIEAVIASDLTGANTKLLPLMVGTDEVINTIKKKYPLLCGQHYVRWEGDPAKVVEKARTLSSVNKDG
jgi:RNA-directed DNA polymerase